MYRSIAFRLLLFTACSGVLLISNNAYSQKKKLKKKGTDSTATFNSIGNALTQTDSLVVTEVKLPLADSADDRPMFSLDGSIMVFGSRRPPMPGETWRQKENPPFYWDGDIYYRVFTDTGWSIPINAGPQINNGGDQNNPTITPKGEEIVFRDNGGIYKAKFNHGAFQKAEPIIGEIQNIYAGLQNTHLQFQFGLQQKILKELAADSSLSELFQRAPETKEVYYRERLMKYLRDDGAIKFYSNITRFESAFSPDGQIVVFSENLGRGGNDGYGYGGQGDDDLWLLKISQNGRWDTVLYMSPIVNSAYSESYPFVAADGRTLYFSSNPVITGFASYIAFTSFFIESKYSLV